MLPPITFPPEFLTPTFWESREIHIALPPHHPSPPSHLLEVTKPHLPEGGCLFLTSGTTGAPKWVALEKRALLHSARVVNAHYDITQADHWLLALPIHHVGGFSILARASLSGSQVTCSQSKWNPETFCESLSESNSTVTSIVPTQLHDLVSTNTQPPTNLRLVLVGGGRIQTDLFKKALAVGWPVCATYGMTEAASQVASQPLDHDRLNDPDTLEVLPHWHTQTTSNNCLIIQGPSLAKGYVTVTDSKSVWESINPATGLQTSDQVRLRIDGTRTFLQFLSRNDSVIKILGELVSIESLEQRLSQLLPLSFPPFAIVPKPDPRRENSLLLVIESPDPEPPPILPPILADFHTKSTPFERIDEIKTHPRFPRTELGKLSRSRLAADLF
jgi:O-succinylbenzoic acid--CoA ligase